MNSRFLGPFAHIALCAIVTALAGCGWGDARSDAELKDAFKEVIGFDATPDVTRVQSTYYWVRDSYIRWIVFDCDETTIKRVEQLPSHPNAEEPLTGLPDYDWLNIGPGNRPNGNPNAPDWWKAGPSDLKGFTIDRSKPNKNTDVTHVCIDHAHHRVYAVRDMIN